jgi:repressor LexA
MSSLGNKAVLSKNLQHYIEKSGKSRKELAKIWGFPYSTLTELINGAKYPRIDKIEIMADYFGILKSDLIEEKFEVGMTQDEQKNSDTIADITNKLFTDKDFLSIVEIISKLDKDQRNRAKEILTLAFPEIAE